MITAALLTPCTLMFAAYVCVVGGWMCLHVCGCGCGCVRVASYVCAKQRRNYSAWYSVISLYAKEGVNRCNCCHDAIEPHW